MKQHNKVFILLACGFFFQQTTLLVAAGEILFLLQDNFIRGSHWNCVAQQCHPSSYTKTITPSEETPEFLEDYPGVSGRQSNYFVERAFFGEVVFENTLPKTKNAFLEQKTSSDQSTKPSSENLEIPVEEINHYVTWRFGKNISNSNAVLRDLKLGVDIPFCTKGKFLNTSSMKKEFITTGLGDLRFFTEGSLHTNSKPMDLVMMFGSELFCPSQKKCPVTKAFPSVDSLIGSGLLNPQCDLGRFGASLYMRPSISINFFDGKIGAELFLFLRKGYFARTNQIRFLQVSRSNSQEYHALTAQLARIIALQASLGFSLQLGNTEFCLACYSFRQSKDLIENFPIGQQRTSPGHFTPSQLEPHVHGASFNIACNISFSKLDLNLKFGFLSCTDKSDCNHPKEGAGYFGSVNILF